MRPWVIKHGGAKVWQLGIDALGYPPTWILSRREAKRLAEELGEILEV